MAVRPNGIVQALGISSFRLYAIGNTVSLVGTWMQRVAVGWLTWEMTGSGAWLGLIAFADLFPTVVIAPFAGALADRVRQLRVIRITQFLGLSQSLVLCGLVATDQLTIWLLLILTLFWGTLSAFDQPARLALISALVPRASLAPAVAINSIMFNLARFVGPAIAGLLIASAEMSMVFAVNSLTFVLYLVALYRIRLAAVIKAHDSGSTFISDMIDGIRYTARHPGISVILMMMIMMAMGGRSIAELLPGIVAEMFASDATGLAIMNSSIGIGAVASGLWLGSRMNPENLTRFLLASTLAVSLANLLFVGTSKLWMLELEMRLWLATPLLAIGGFCMSGNGIATQTLVQLCTDGAYRGRVLSLFGMITRGGPAIGALIMGVISEYIGLEWSVILGAFVVLAGWLWARMRSASIAALIEESKGGGAETKEA